jgi:hypothetical protein
MDSGPSRPLDRPEYCRCRAGRGRRSNRAASRFRLPRCAHSAASREPPARDCHWCPGRRGAHCSTSGAPRPAPHLAARTDVGELLVSFSSVANSWESPQFESCFVGIKTDRIRPPGEQFRSIQPNRGRPIAWSAIDRLRVPIRRGINRPLTRFQPLSGKDGTRSREIPSGISRRRGDHRPVTGS